MILGVDVQMSNVIEIRNLSFSYDYEEENRTLVLDDVTLDIERGSYTVIVGHNGSVNLL